MAETFRKAERLCSKKSIETLFAGSSRAISVYPLRAVYKERAETLPQKGAGGSGEAVRLLISVSKRHFRHAVDRNRTKRLIREAYRHHRQLLTNSLADRHIDLALIWMSNSLSDYPTVESRIKVILQRIAEELKEVKQ